ncbi:MAG: DUF3048 domain-containing protein [Anaerolineae bacterium]
MGRLANQLFFVCLLTAALVACQRSGGNPADLASPVSATAAVAAAAPPTAVPSPTLSPAATFTPIPTPSDTPAGTAAPTPIPTPTETPTLAPAPLVFLTAADFSPDRSPFTGEIATEPSNLLRRPIAIKISNSPAEWVRPQSGLSQADLVFEHYAEGATRFTAVFHSQTPPKLGPIRSARLIDLELPAMYNAAFAFSGAHVYTEQQLRESDFRARLIWSFEDGYYRTGEEKPWEHTLYAETAALWRRLDIKGQNAPPQLANVMPFDQRPLPGGDPAFRIEIGYYLTVVEYRFDPETGRFWRWADGEPHLDANNGEQLSAANVVVVVVEHEMVEDVCVYAQGGECQVNPMLIKLWGEGEAFLFRDGREYPARWQRRGRHDMLTLVRPDGVSLPFQLGNTWFQILPAGSTLAGYVVWDSE